MKRKTNIVSGRSFGVGRYSLWCFEPVPVTDQPERLTRLRLDLVEVFAELTHFFTHEQGNYYAKNTKTLCRT